MTHPRPTLAAFHYRQHTSAPNCSWRVWNVGWGGDMFEILTPDEFTAFAGFCRRFSLPIQPATED